MVGRDWDPMPSTSIQGRFTGFSRRPVGPSRWSSWINQCLPGWATSTRTKRFMHRESPLPDLRERSPEARPRGFFEARSGYCVRRSRRAARRFATTETRSISPAVTRRDTPSTGVLAHPVGVAGVQSIRANSVGEPRTGVRDARPRGGFIPELIHKANLGKRVCQIWRSGPALFFLMY